MRLNVQTVLILAAFVVCIASAVGRAPLWISVFLIILLMLLEVLPR